jgi:hypothetical protein
MTRERLTKRREEFDALLAQRRKVTADTAEHGHSHFGAEATGDLLWHFDHAQIALRQVIIERNGKKVKRPWGDVTCGSRSYTNFMYQRDRASAEVRSHLGNILMEAAGEPG